MTNINSQQRVRPEMQSRRLALPILRVVALFLLCTVAVGSPVKQPEDESSARTEMINRAASGTRRANAARITSRKLLGVTDRIADTCTKSDISIFQGHSSPLPNGIPTFTVQILNLCVRGCPISNIHVSCGWFASAKLVNPAIFKRLKYDDCLVNDGKPIQGGDSISFQYANSFEYPMRVASAETC